MGDIFEVFENTMSEKHEIVLKIKITKNNKKIKIINFFNSKKYN